MQTKPNLDDIQADRSIDTLVHLGAGQCSELDGYLAREPQRLLLVEADPQLAGALQARIDGHAEVQVHCAAVAGRPGPATFHRYNLPDVNSLHAASGLLQLFPGLKTVEHLPMDAVSPAALVEPLKLQPEQENHLIIDLPGEELPVLQALHQARQLHLFRWLQLHCGREPLYENSEPATRVLQWLRDEGFDLLTEDDSRDPDRPCWTLQRNTLQLRNLELQRQMEALKARLEQALGEREGQAKLAAGQQSEIQQLTKARDEQIRRAADLSAQLEQMTKAKDEQARQALERQKAVEALTQKQNDLSKQAAELHALVQRLTQEREAQSKLAGERQAQIEQLTKARDEQTKLAAERQSLLEQANKAKTEQAKLADERRIQIEQLARAKDEAAKQAAERQQQITQLTQARDEQAKLATERQAQIQQLTKTQSEQKSLIESQKAEIGKLQASLQDAKNRSSQLETQLPEMERRQHLMNEELVKAEGQIDLIKDLLLREPGL